jgi:hypothetical protein
MQNEKQYIIMFFIMIFTGLLSTMNVWASSLSDVRWSINDLYMSFLMTGWMFLFMGLLNKNLKVSLFGFIIVVITILCIRTQFLVNQKQYLNGMISHHSMAVFMSEKLLNKKNDIPEYLNNIIKNQSDEITYMKNK